MMRQPLLLAAALVATVLSGCAREQDPSRAGFFSGIGNMATGTYDERQRRLETQAADSEKMKQDMAALARRNEADRAQTDADLLQAQARIVRMDDELARQQRQIDQARRSQRASETELRRAQDQIAALRREKERLDREGGPSNEADTRRVNQMLDDLNRSVGQLSRAQ